MSIEYQAPTNLIASYSPSLLQTSLSWDAAIDGVSTKYTTPGTYTYAVDSTSDHIIVAAVGAGSGGAGGLTSNGWSGGSGQGGAGGAYAQATYATSDLGSSYAVNVGAGGPGGAGFVQNYGTTVYIGPDGTDGGDSTFGSLVTAGGASGTPVGMTDACPGGVAAVTGGTSVITENGADGGPYSYENTLTPPSTGPSSTYAGAGGAGGIGNATSTGPTGAGPANAGGASANGTAGAAGTSDFLYPASTLATAGPGGNGGGVSLPVSSGGFAIPSIAGGGGGGGGGFAAVNGQFGGAPGSVGGVGGTGGLYGGGGGGGGASENNAWGNFVTCPVTTGDGGPGANGAVEVIQFWYHNRLPYYLIFRNGILVGVAAPGATSYVDDSPPPGVDVYVVVASYDGLNVMSPNSNEATITVAGGLFTVFGTFVEDSVSSATCVVNIGNIEPKIHTPLGNTTIRSSG